MRHKRRREVELRHRKVSVGLDGATQPRHRLLVLAHRELGHARRCQQPRRALSRTALNLTKLYKSIGRPRDARVVLEPAPKSFTLSSELPEIAEAQGWLDMAGPQRALALFVH